MENDLLQIGVKLYKEGKMTEAVDKMKEYLAQQPADIAARTYLGAALGQLNRYPEAAEEFLCLTRLDPGNIRHYYNLGQAYEAFDSDLQAIGAYEKALQIEPEHTKSKERIKVIEAKQKNITETQAVAPPSPQTPVNEPPIPWVQQSAPQQPPVQPCGAPPPPQNHNQQQSYGAPPSPYQNNAPTSVGYNVQPQNMQYAMPDWLVVLLLVLLTPVGIIFMWWKSRWGSGAKWVVTVVWLVLCIVAYLGVRMETNLETQREQRYLVELKDAVESIEQDRLRTDPISHDWYVISSELTTTTETGYDYIAVIQVQIGNVDMQAHTTYLHKNGGDKFDWVLLEE